jgi:hypothetical protein
LVGTELILVTKVDLAGLACCVTEIFHELRHDQASATQADVRRRWCCFYWDFPW